MGIIYYGVPRELVLWLKQELELDTFLETGTNVGDTTAWAAEHFSRVISIEADQRLLNISKEKLARYDNVELHLGRSQELLKTILPSLEPSLIWLDAHWSGAGTAGEERECPLLEEIDAIDSVENVHCILIDDARLFLNPPPDPHKPTHWPSIGAVESRLRARHSDVYITVWQDVIIRTKKSTGGRFEAFLGSSVTERAGSNEDVSKPKDPGNLLRRIRGYFP